MPPDLLQDSKYKKVSGYEDLAIDFPNENPIHNFGYTIAPADFLYRLASLSKLFSSHNLQRLCIAAGRGGLIASFVIFFSTINRTEQILEVFSG